MDTLKRHGHTIIGTTLLLIGFTYGYTTARLHRAINPHHNKPKPPK